MSKLTEQADEKEFAELQGHLMEHYANIRPPHPAGLAKWALLALQTMQADCAAMRLQYEKYVRANCKLIRHGVADGLKEPDEVDGKCGGYATASSDEPHPTCQECIAAYNPDDDYSPGTQLQERLQAAKDFVDSIEPPMLPETKRMQRTIDVDLWRKAKGV